MDCGGCGRCTDCKRLRDIEGRRRSPYYRPPHDYGSDQDPRDRGHGQSCRCRACAPNDYY